MKNLKRKMTRKDSMRAVHCRLNLENLEDRRLPGEAFLSGLLAEGLFNARPGIVNINKGKGG